jgi:hypothetical protein
MSKPGSSPRTRAVPHPASLALALLVAACGGAAPGDGVVSLQDPSTSPDPSAAAPSASMDPEDAMQAFAACMREHGVDVQVSIAGDGEGGFVNIGGGSATGPGEAPAKGAEAQPGGQRLDRDEMAEADEACRHLLPNGGRGDPTATMDPEMADQMLAFSACMRDHGIDFPDPVFEGGGVSISLGGPDGEGPDPSSEEFQAAQEACSAAMPDGGPFMRGGAEPESKP